MVKTYGKIDISPDQTVVGIAMGLDPSENLIEEKD